MSAKSCIPNPALGAASSAARDSTALYPTRNVGIIHLSPGAGDSDRTARLGTKCQLAAQTQRLIPRGAQHWSREEMRPHPGEHPGINTGRNIPCSRHTQLKPRQETLPLVQFVQGSRAQLCPTLPNSKDGEKKEKKKRRKKGETPIPPSAGSRGRPAPCPEVTPSCLSWLCSARAHPWLCSALGQVVSAVRGCPAAPGKGPRGGTEPGTAPRLTLIWLTGSLQARDTRDRPQRGDGEVGEVEVLCGKWVSSCVGAAQA